MVSAYHDLHHPHRHHGLTAPQWVALVAGSVVLAIASVSVLWSRAEKPGLDRVGNWYDTAELFARETIRLSFTQRLGNDHEDAVYVAPKGLLDKDMEFVLLDASLDFSSAPEREIAAAVAPRELLDPNWLPSPERSK